VLEGIAGLGMGVGVGVNTAYQAKQEVAKLNQETKDIIKQDLESKGINATDEQLDEVVESVNKIREEKKQNVARDNNRVDTGTNQPSVPVSEEQAGQGTTTGAGETTTTDMGGAGQTVAGLGNRETNEPSALESKTVEELQDIKNNYEVEQKTNLYKNGNIPKEGTKRRQEYDALQIRIDNVNSLITQKTKLTTPISNVTETTTETPTETPTETAPLTIPTNSPVPITPESQTKAAKLGEYQNAMIDAMNGSTYNPALVPQETLNELESNELIKLSADNKLELLPKGKQMLVQMQKGGTNLEEVFANFIKPTDFTQFKEGVPGSNVTEAVTPEKTEEQLQAEEDAREEEFRAKAETEIDQQGVGLALARIENGDFETKPKLKTFVNRLVKDGVLEDVDDVLEAFSDREQTVDDVLDMVREKLDEARDNAIDEHIDEQRNEYETNPPVEQTTEQVTPEKTAEETAEENKVRTANNIPRIETLPEDLQRNPIVLTWRNTRASNSQKASPCGPAVRSADFTSRIRNRNISPSANSAKIRLKIWPSAKAKPPLRWSAGWGRG
jgi:hypothetical protein